MKCRCGHGRQWHRRASGKVRLPCQMFTRRDRTPGGWPIGPVVKCRCRDWHPKEAA